jgi:hypothetical protein
MLSYYGGKKPESRERCEGYIEQWDTWEEDIGDDLIDAGKPLGKPKIISSAGITDSGPNPLTGFSILEANNIDAALIMVKSNPHLNIGGTIEVAELLETCH